MKGKVLLLIVSIIAIAAVVLIFVCCRTPSIQNSIDSIFACSTFEELERYVQDNKVACETHDNVMHLYNVEYSGQVGYCVAEFYSNTKELRKMSFYALIENNEETLKVIENVRTTFVTEFGFEAEYEYFPLHDGMDTVTEKDFFEQNASLELFVFDSDMTWNISWLVVENGVSARISKHVDE